MGDIADDILDSALRMDDDVSFAIHCLRQKCREGDCPHAFRFNDDGLLECPKCHRMTDV